MRYIFKILIMGLNTEVINSYTIRAFEEEGQDQEYFLEWYKEINVFEDICDLEINAIIDNLNADFDEIIPTVDGIIYFINPKREEEKNFFEMILPVIDSVKRDIPMVLIFNDEYGFLPLSTNKVLEDLWFNHFNLEGFLNLNPKDFYQALQCLCLAMISGDSPLNIENAWMRFPIYIQLANIFFKKATKDKKPEFFYYAAQNVRKAALIADILNKEEYYIISEQAALLYSKANLFLEASKIINIVNSKKAKSFKKLYAESMILEGNKLYNNKKYDSAAEQYLAAAQWLAIEMNYPELRDESFRLSITSWISACRVEMAFSVLSSLPHETALIILQEAPDKIISAANFLVNNGNLDAARDQLYRAIIVYQKEGLFDLLEKFTYKLEEVLIKLLEYQIKNNERYPAKQTYDEIENLWESYDVDRTNLDKILELLVKLFLDFYDFSNSTDLINKIESLSVKKNLTKLSSKVEEDFKKLRKTEIEENVNRGIEILKTFIEEELQIINGINSQIISEANKLIDTKNYLDAADIVKPQADLLKSIGREEIQNEILVKVLDILVLGKYFNRFIKTFEELAESNKQDYLNSQYNFITEKLKEVSEEAKFRDLEPIFETFITFYREQMLYERSKDISRLFIDFIKNEALKLLQNEKNLNTINAALNFIKRAIDISLAYLEGEKQNFDQIYQSIIDIYLSQDKLAEANSINEKIEDKWLKNEINKKIVKKETEKSAVDRKKVEDSLKEKHLKQMYSIIKSKAREAYQGKESELNKRKSLKRAYFEKALDYLNAKNFDAAIEEYKISLDRLIRKRDYYLAGVSLAIIYILMLNQNISQGFNKFIETTKAKLSGLEKLFSDTIPATLVEYIKDVEEFGDTLKFREALLFLENLPLFEEEISLLNSLLGIEEHITPKSSDNQEILTKTEGLKERIIILASQIEKEGQTITQRQILKQDYWRLALEDLSSRKYFVSIEEYVEAIPRLLDIKQYNFAGINLTISTLVNVKLKNVIVAKNFLDEKINKFNQIYPEFESLPEVKITKELITTIEFNKVELTSFGLKILIEQLPLFEPEIKFLETFLQENISGEEAEKIISRKELARQRTLEIDMEQIYGNLNKQIPDMLREKKDFTRKRNILKKRIYIDVLKELNQGNLMEASKYYFELAISMAKRQDLITSSLLLLLHGLCLIKEKESIVKVNNNTNDFLDSLGANKKLVKDTFYIRLIQFIGDAILYKLEKFYDKIKSLLQVLPLLDEETPLIDIF
jgi:hypothetical protein